MKDELNERYSEINDVRIKIAQHHGKHSADFKRACAHDTSDELINELALKEEILKYYQMREEFRLFLNKKAQRYLNESLLRATRVFLYAEKGYYDFIKQHEADIEIDYKIFYRSFADQEIDKIREQARKDLKKYLKE
ncbi:MAG: hypothetical protein ACOYVF_13270 [Candidatus Zixiibacteriota bacterium]